MESQIGESIIKYLESILEELDTLNEDGAIAAPATDSSSTNGALPVVPFGSVARRKKLEDE